MSSLRLLGAVGWITACGVNASPETPRENHGVSYGTEDPVVVLDVDPKAEWVAICQSRAKGGERAGAAYFGRHGENFGSQLHPYVVVNSGPGERVSLYLGRDPNGDHFLVEKEGRLVLHDVRSHQKQVLNQAEWDLERDPRHAPRRFAKFDPKGRYLALLPRTSGDARVVLVDLSTTNSRSVNLGSGRVWNIGFSDDGRWLAADIVAERTGDVFELPKIHSTSRSAGRCSRGPNWGYRNEKGHRGTRHVVAHLESGNVLPAADRLSFFGDAILVQAPDGAVLMQKSDGATRELVPADCRGEVAVVAPEQETLLVACGARDAEKAIERLPQASRHEGADAVWRRKVRLRAFGLGRSKHLGVVPSRFSSMSSSMEGRFGIVSEQGEYPLVRIFDFETWGWVPLDRPDATCAKIANGFAFQMVDGKTDAVSLSTGGRRTLSEAVCGHSQQRGEYLLLGADLIHLPSMTRVGVHERGCTSAACGLDLYLGYDGRILAAKHFAESNQVPRGPLVWLSAKPVRPR